MREEDSITREAAALARAEAAEGIGVPWGVEERVREVQEAEAARRERLEEELEALQQQLASLGDAQVLDTGRHQARRANDLLRESQLQVCFCFPLRPDREVIFLVGIR